MIQTMNLKNYKSDERNAAPKIRARMVSETAEPIGPRAVKAAKAAAERAQKTSTRRMFTHPLIEVVRDFSLQSEHFDFNGETLFHAQPLDPATLPSIWTDLTQLRARVEACSSHVRWSFNDRDQHRKKGYHSDVSTWTNTRTVAEQLLNEAGLTPEQLLAPVGPVCPNREHFYVLSMHRHSNMLLHYDPLPGVLYLVLGPPRSYQVIIFLTVITGDTNIYRKLGLSTPHCGSRDNAGRGVDLGEAPPIGWEQTPAPLPAVFYRILTEHEQKQLRIEYHRVDAYTLTVFNGGVAHGVWNMGVEDEAASALSCAQWKIGLNFTK